MCFLSPIGFLLRETKRPQPGRLLRLFGSSCVEGPWRPQGPLVILSEQGLCPGSCRAVLHTVGHRFVPDAHRATMGHKGPLNDH